MRLGGFFSDPYQDPAAWIEVLKAKQYRAAYSPFKLAPFDSMPPDETVAAYRKAAQKADIIISEVGGWGLNPLSEDETERKRTLEDCKERLDLAEQLGARCMVNVAGKREDPSEHFSEATFTLIVDTLREIIDAVKPQHTAMTLEMVPRMIPNSVESYLRLIQAVDRKAFAVHFDPVNLIDNPQKYYENRQFLKHCLEKLGPWLRSCHAKDVILRPGMIVHVDETRPGLGNLDYKAFIRLLDAIDPDMPLMLEHLSTDAEYDLAAAHVRSQAPSNGL